MKTRFIFLVLMLSLNLVVFSYGNTTSDSVDVSIREAKFIQHHFSSELISYFKQDSDFLYELPPAERPSLLKAVIDRFIAWLIVVFGNEIFAWLIFIILTLLGVVGLGFALYGLFGIGKTVPIYSRESSELEYSVKEENIHEINFSDEIENAVAQKDYKKAVRLVYLFSLKLLTDNNIVEWSPGKTNHDYLYEIPSKDLKGYFSKLCYYFEYVWYGDFQAGIRQYEEISTTLKEFKKNLQRHASI